MPCFSEQRGNRVGYFKPYAISYYQRALADLNELEDILSGNDVENEVENEGGVQPVLKDDADMDDFNSAAQKNWLSWRNKRNYNLDHLARMNFKRSYGSQDHHKRMELGKFNNRHILGGLRRRK